MKPHATIRWGGPSKRADLEIVLTDTDRVIIEMKVGSRDELTAANYRRIVAQRFAEGSHSRAHKQAHAVVPQLDEARLAETAKLWAEYADSAQSYVDPTHPPVPPPLAEFVGALFLKTEHRQSMLGCRAEDFAHNVQRFGRRRAAVLYWRDVAESTWPTFRSFIKRVFASSVIIEFCKRFMGP